MQVCVDCIGIFLIPACRLSGIALSHMQAQAARIKSLLDAKNQLRLCYDTVLQVGSQISSIILRQMYILPEPDDHIF